MWGKGSRDAYYFTDAVRQALAASRDEAIKLQHDYVGTEHILLGLLRLREGIAAAVFARAQIQPDDIRTRVLECVRKGKASIAIGELPYTSRAKKVLEFALSSARDLGHDHVGTEHLLLGLVREENGIAAQILASLGLTWERSALLVGEELSAERTAGSRVFRVQIDDASDRSIYEQIIAQVQEAVEAVATGALRSGDRLQPVRQLADDLDIAPGTVARAYSELERLGVVVTGGARGTRVAERAADRSEINREETLVGLLRPVAVAAFHLGGSADELRVALEKAMTGIYNPTSS
jgi:DNA-binding transcriptional regulator YhcF (GntR family)